MSDAFHKILAAVPGPVRPVDCGTDDGWRAVEAELGLVLPDDYKSLIDHYGAGFWRGRVLMLSAFSPNRYTNQREIVRGHLYWPDEPDPPSTDPAFLRVWNSIREAVRRQRAAAPYPYYPDPGGLFPWAQARPEGVTFYWRTMGPPRLWPTVIETWRADEGSFSWRTYPLPSCELLWRWVTSELRLEGVPSEGPGLREAFRSRWPYSFLPSELG